MNLWVKRTGQLLVAALLFASCEDDTFLLGFKNQANKFNVKYQDFLIGGGSVISTEALITDNFGGVQRMLIGEDIDPALGEIRAEAFTEFWGDTARLKKKLDHTYVFDSLTVQLHVDNYFYGLSSTETGKFIIHRITEPEPFSYTKDKVYTVPGSGKEIHYKEQNRYYSNSTAQYSPEVLGETRFEQIFLFQKKLRSTSVNIDRDRLTKSTKDTLVAVARLHDDFGLELFNVVLEDADGELSDREKFKARFKGLAFIPENCTSILGFNPASNFTKVKLHYHTTLNGSNVDTLAKEFSLSGSTTNQIVNFHNLTVNRAAGLPLPDETYEGTDPNIRVIQNGVPLITRIDLSDFYSSFVDQIADKNIVINSAEILIEAVDAPTSYNPLPLLELRIMEETDSFKNYATLDQITRDSLKKFFVLTDNRYYYVNNDASPNAAYLLYNSTKKSYSGSITLFIQNLFNNKNSQIKLPHLGLYSATTATGINSLIPVNKSIDRTVFLKENIKLRVYYTVPNNSNL
jgi:hypothetical protein